MMRGRAVLRLSLRLLAVASLAIVVAEAVAAVRGGGAVMPHAVAAAALALAFLTALVPSTRGTWSAGLSASVAVLLGAVGIADGAEGAGFGAIHGLVSQLAQLGDRAGVAQVVGAILLLAHAWIESGRRSLGLPRWAGLAAAILCFAPGLVVWMLLLARDQRIVLQQADLRERALVMLLRARLDLTMGSLADQARALRVDGDAVEAASRAVDALDDTEGVSALLCIDARGAQRWIAPPSASGEPPVRDMLAGESDERAAAACLVQGRAVVVDPSHGVAPTDAPDVIVALPLGSDRTQLAAIFLVDVDSILASVVESIDPGAPVELLDADRAAAVSANGGPVGRSVPWDGATFVIRALPSADDADRGGNTFPDLLLASLAAACGLVGSTVHFAQRSAERARASSRSRQQLEQLIEASDTVAVIATDREGLVTIFNEGAERITGFASVAMAGRTGALELFDPDELGSLPIRPGLPAALMLEQLARSPEFRVRDWTWVGAGGRRRRVSVAVRPWLEPDGSPLGFLLVAIDVTERERAMLGVERARAAAEDRSEAKASLLAGVTHEIRSPMAAILSAADLLADESSTPEDRAEWLRAIRANGTHLLGIINDILDISRIEAGRMPVESIEVRPLDLVNDVLQLLKVQAAAKGIALALDSADAGAGETIRTDPLRVRQVLVNLVTNAIRHTSHGGVGISVRTSRTGDVLEVEFDVTDTGEGMTQEQVDCLFADYVQVSASEAGRSGGTGLGLAISRRIAELLEGSVSVRSVPGEGSVFTFRISARLVTPAVRTACASGAEATDAHSPASRRPLEGIRILLSEEETGNRRMLADVLVAAGAEVEACDSCADAVAAVERAAGRRVFDVALLDLQERGSDGIASVCRLRDMGFPGRIVAMSGRTLDVDRESCLAAGCDAFAVKPIAPEELVRLCRG
ncbi:MAG: PAS domain S-box protein [Phycisphaerales bacterium]|nr:PAS domain S-box protein [Phycisphaerales bacterium]